MISQKHDKKTAAEAGHPQPSAHAHPCKRSMQLHVSVITVRPRRRRRYGRCRHHWRPPHETCS
eukprot:5869733-Prymnesium_polylepis.1